jgi:hypothetical protein
LDILILVLSVAACVAAGLWAWDSVGKEPTLVVSSDSGLYQYPLNKDARFEVSGPLGKTTIVIRAGQAYIEDSPCANKLCVNMGKISKNGQWVSCLPNKVFVRVEGSGAKGGVDAASY